MTESVTVDEMQADSDAALAIMRAQGIPVPTERGDVLIFRLGFSAGAQWALDKITTRIKQSL